MKFQSLCKIDLDSNKVFRLPKKLYSSKLFVFIVQAHYWLVLFHQPIVSLLNKNKHLG